MEEVKTATEYRQDISGSLSELEDVMRIIENKVSGNPPMPDGTPPQPNEPVSNKAEEIRNRIKRQVQIAKKIREGLKLF